MVEVIVVIAITTMLAAAALTFFIQRQEMAQQQIAAGNLAEAIQQVWRLPNGQPLTWAATANALIAQSVDADRPANIPTVGTRVDGLPNGLHVGRAVIADEALMLDTTGAAVAIPGCAIGDVQVTLRPLSLPAGSELHSVNADWISGSLDAADPEWIIEVADDTLFLCLPA